MQNTQINLSEKKIIFLNLKKLVEYHGTPISTISSYVQSFITKQVSNEGYKVFYQELEQMRFLQDIMIIFTLF